MNKKLYNNKIMMRTKVTLIYPSSGRNTNVVTFSIKEMILKVSSKGKSSVDIVRYFVPEIQQKNKAIPSDFSPNRDLEYP